MKILLGEEMAQTKKATGALDRRDGRRDKTNSFREAEQLPDKPAPVVSEQPVTGLPDHLMPKAPKRSSPPFERLRRTLSRSPSPIMHMKAVQSVASLLLDPEMAAKTHLEASPGTATAVDDAAPATLPTDSTS